MRKVTFGGANSLDNFLARKDDAVDWLRWGPEAGEIMKDYWSNIDTVVMGRRTYEIANKGGGGFSGIKCYVFSKTLEPKEEGDLTILNSDPVEKVRELKAQPGKEICVMGGGLLAKPLFEAGLIDEIGFNVHPVLLGRGIPLFHEMSRQIDLELLECRPFKNGCVYLLYKVVNPAD